MFGWFKRKKTIETHRVPPIRKMPAATSPPPPRRSSNATRSTPTDSALPDDGFAASIGLGYALNDGVVGGLIGGNLVGGIIGDALNTSEEKEKSQESPSAVDPPADSGNGSSIDHDSTSHSSYDGGGSFDSGSSYDSGSSSYGE
jgi:hypothetical protein